MPDTGKHVTAVIPARYGSTRFPGKPLAMIAGKPMIQRACECAGAAALIDDVIVATDDERIRDAVHAFGGKVAMTSAAHETGTDRIAEAVAGVDTDIVVNVQGDEPAFPGEVIDDLIRAMVGAGAEMGTVAVPFGLTTRRIEDKNAVKVVLDTNGYALYFSRAPIPFSRNGGVRVEPLLHWGVYAYRKDFLETFVSWPRGRLEECEMLEQLRAVENGVRILVSQTTASSVGVDVPADIPLVEALLKARAEAEV